VQELIEMPLLKKDKNIVGITPKDPSEQNHSKKNFSDQLAPLLNEDCEL
jgi:hypothetical protein